MCHKGLVSRVHYDDLRHEMLSKDHDDMTWCWNVANVNYGGLDGGGGGGGPEFGIQ